MSPYEPYEPKLSLVIDRHDHSIFVAAHVEGNPATFQDTCRSKLCFECLRRWVSGFLQMTVQFDQRFYYKGCMFSNLPNLAVVFGYLNASWTLRADINSDYVCRVLEHMRKTGTTIATPVLTPQAEAAITEDDVFDFSSGYIQRGKHIMPRNSVSYPWRLNQEYVVDRKRMKDDPLTDGLLTFTRAGANAQRGEEQLEAAE